MATKQEQYTPWVEPLPGMLRQSIEGHYAWLSQLVEERLSALPSKMDSPEWDAAVSQLVDAADQRGFARCGLIHDDTLRRAAGLPKRRWK